MMPDDADDHDSADFRSILPCFEALQPGEATVREQRADRRSLDQEFKFLRELAKDIPAILKSAEPEG